MIIFLENKNNIFQTCNCNIITQYINNLKTGFKYNINIVVINISKYEDTRKLFNHIKINNAYLKKTNDEDITILKDLTMIANSMMMCDSYNINEIRENAYNNIIDKLSKYVDIKKYNKFISDICDSIKSCNYVIYYNIINPITIFTPNITKKLIKIQ